MQVIAQHSPRCPFLAEAVVFRFGTAVMNTASAPVTGDTAPTYTDPALSHKLSLLYWHFPLAVSQAQTHAINFS